MFSRRQDGEGHFSEEEQQGQGHRGVAVWTVSGNLEWPIGHGGRWRQERFSVSPRVRKQATALTL